MTQVPGSANNLLENSEDIWSHTSGGGGDGGAAEERTLLQGGVARNTSNTINDSHSSAETPQTVAGVSKLAADADKKNRGSTSTTRKSKDRPEPLGLEGSSGRYDAGKARDVTLATDDRDGEELESLNSYGVPRYRRRYGDDDAADDGGGAGGHPELAVPWNLRRPGPRRFFEFFDFLRNPQFWWQFEFAARITCIPVLVPAAILAADVKNHPFVSPYMVFSSTVLAAKVSVGDAVCYLFAWMRSGIFWFPFAVIAGAGKIHHHMAGWCVYYTAMLIIFALFSEGIGRRICLLLFNSCTVGLLMHPENGVLYSCRVMVDWCIGTMLCAVAIFIPYPVFSKRKAQQTLDVICKNTGTAFRGLVYAFWSANSVERNMAMAKVRAMTESLDTLYPHFEHSQGSSFFEFFFEKIETRELRDLKFKFLELLRVNLSSMTRVLDIVEANPHIIDDSERCHAFGEILMPSLVSAAGEFDELMTRLCHAHSKKALLETEAAVENFKRRAADVQRSYLTARQKFFYEHTSPVLEEFVPLMTFYLFTIVCLFDTVTTFEKKLERYEPSYRRFFKQLYRKVFYGPLEENIQFVIRLFKKFERQDIQRVVEAVKVAGAMILTVGFSFLIRIPRASFSGPNIIAFVSGMNPVEAVQASIVRLTGCLIGTVLGFFASTYAETQVQRVASLCVLMFCGTFLRNDKEYGVMAVYAMFVLIPLDNSVKGTIQDAVDRMNQNTFGIFIYLAISIVIFPLSPSLMLRNKRAAILRKMSGILSEFSSLFTTPLARSTSKIESDSTAHSPEELLHRSMAMRPAEEDATMIKLTEQILAIERQVRGTRELMGFAHEERGLVEITYPVRACTAVYGHMYRMTALLRTMCLSWSILRSQRHFTPEMKHMLLHLRPIMCDVAAAFQDFSNSMSYMLRDPSINLEKDLAGSIINLLECTEELNHRKNEIMLVLIHQSVANIRELRSLDASPDAGTDSAPLPPPPADDNSGEGARDERRELGPYSLPHSKVPSRLAPGAARRTQSHMPLKRTFSFSPTTAVAPGSFYRVSPTARNTSLMPRGATTVSGAYAFTDPGDEFTEGVCTSAERVELPNDFQMPITSEDAEGMHSFCLSLEMFADETKKLTINLDDMIDVLRAAM